jgi:hypothetical protein
MAATPGPWTSHPGSDDIHAVENGALIAVVSRLRAEHAANAALIAASPDLLLALKLLVPVDFDDHPQDFAPEWRAARAAIERATGGGA